MAQHDYDIANQSGANFRADLNNALDAIVSNNSGSSEPSTKFAYEWWIDTSNNLLKLRNSANNAWITLPLSITADNATSGALTVNGNLSTTGTVDINGQELILDADADTSITADTDDQIDFRVGAVDVMTLTNSHLVLKGTTPKITIGDGGEEDTALIFNGNAQDFHIGLDDSADDLVIGTGSTVGSNQKIILEDGGNIGAGTTAPSCRLHLQAPLTSDTQTTPETILKLSSTFNSTGSDGQAGCGARIEFEIPDDETNPITGSAIAGLKENGDDSNAESALAFYTSQNDTTLDEAGRFDSGGNFLLNTTDKTGGGQLGTSRFCLKINGAADNGILVHDTRTSSGTDNALVFVRGSSTVGTIQTSTTTTSFNVNSDYRLKENVNYEFDALSRVAQLKPARFNFIVEKDETVDGFLAHEVQDIVPQAITGEKDAVDDEGKNIYQGIDQSKLVPLLTKAIQELEARVKTLEG